MVYFAWDTGNVRNKRYCAAFFFDPMSWLLGLASTPATVLVLMAFVRLAWKRRVGERL